MALCTMLLACSSSEGARASNSRAPAVSAPATAPQQAAPAARPARLPKVVFLGDSISAGLHLPAEEAFPAVLQRMFEQRGVPFELINAGISGDTSSGGLRRTDWILRQKPDVVVLELGANDGLRGLPIMPMEENLRAIIRKVRAQNVPVLLLGMRLPTSHGPAYNQSFEEAYARLASDLKVPLVPFFMHDVAGIAALNLEDGLHPNAAGHELLAKNVAEALEPLVRAAAPAR